MSLPFIKCPKCSELSSSQDYWTCPACGYSESKENVLLEENKDYEEQRNKNWENRDDELNRWMTDQKKLCKKIIKECLPNRNIKIRFRKHTSWGYTRYRENDLITSQKALQRCSQLISQGRYLEAVWLENYGLTKYTNEPTIINVSPHTLKTKYSYDTSYGPRGAGFLPTTTHESAHASYLVTHNSQFQPWINDGHDDKWREIAIKLHDEMLTKYGREIKERFKKLEEIEKKEQ